MTKGLKALFIILIILVGVLAATTGLFYARTISLENKNKVGSEKTTAKTDTSALATTAPASKEATNSSAATTAAPLNNRPSSPADTVIIASGETLFEIGQKVGVSWTILADVNGIDANKIKAGDVIIVPKNNMINYTVNTEKAAALQKEVDGGKLPFRLSAAETAKSDSSPIYGLLTTDTYTQDKIDETAGTATVVAVKGDKKYTISLTQPVTKGVKGIWAITTIKAQ